MSVALLLGALFAVGCLPSGRPVVLANDTGETVVARAITLKTVGVLTFPPGALQTTYPLRTGAVGYRLSTNEGERGCLTIARQPASGPAELLRFSSATAACPAVPLAGFVHLTTTVSRALVWLQLLGYVFGPVAAGVWIVMWARRTPGKSVRLALFELGGLCILSLAILAALLHWGVPRP